MKNTHKNLLAMGLASAILASAPAYAEPEPGWYGPMMGGPGMMRGYGPMAGPGLELSDEQLAKKREIQRELFKQETALREKMFDEYTTLEQLSEVDKPDPKALGEAHDRVNALRRQMIEARIHAHNKMFDLLTEEQRKVWRAHRKQMRGMAWGGMGMMGPGMMGPGMMGPGMMGPGMMGPGMMGPGMMGPGYGPWWQDDE